MSKKQKSLKRQFEVLTIGFCAVIIIAIVSVCLFLILPSLARVNRDEENMYNQVQRNIEYKLENAKAVAESIAYDGIVQRFLRMKDVDNRIDFTTQMRSIADKMGIMDKSLRAIYIYCGDTTILNYPVRNGSDSTLFLPNEKIREEIYYSGIGWAENRNSYMYYSCAVYDNDINNYVSKNRIGTVVVIFDSKNAFAENELVCNYVIADIDKNIVFSNYSEVPEGRIVNSEMFEKPKKIAGTENLVYFKSNINYWTYLSIRMGILLIVAIIICLLLFAVNHVWLYKGFLNPIDNIVREIREMKESNGSYLVSEEIAENEECEEIIGAINFFIQENEKRNNDIIKMKEDIYRHQAMTNAMEAEYLKQQIKPHFLYNTLGCIRSVAMRNGNETIADSINSLISILRYGTNTVSEVTIREEIDIIKLHVELLNMRFNNKFKLKIHINPELEGIKITKLLIQPVIENCIKHAYRDYEDVARIDMSIEKDGERISIVIRDYGCGIDEESLLKIHENLNEANLKTTSVGMYNVNKRIKLIYGEDYGLFINSIKGKGTSVEIRIKDKIESSME